MEYKGFTIELADNKQTYSIYKDEKLVAGFSGCIYNYTYDIIKEKIDANEPFLKSL